MAGTTKKVSAQVAAAEPGLSGLLSPGKICGGSHLFA